MGDVKQQEMWEPWVEHKDLWKSQSAFFTYLRSALRKSLWLRSPVKLQYKNRVCKPPPDGMETRAKTGTYCALSNNWYGKSKLDVDHQKGGVSLNCVDDIIPFIMHLVPPKDGMQLVGREEHKIKSYSERMGISYEEAVIAKKVIQLMKKKVDIANKELLSYGYKQEEVSNAVKRKAAYTQLVKDGRIQ